MKPITLLLGALLCGAPIAASAQVGIGIGINLGGPVYREAPPAPLVETFGPAPGPGFFWIGGHWTRLHGRWIWINGHWDHRVGYAWSPGHWAQASSGWVWVEGQWVAPAPRVVVQMAPASAPGEIFVQAAPPPPIVETYGPAPGPDYIFITGHWGWGGGRWVWNRGYWGRHPHWHAGAGWEAGRWDRRGGGYVWREGHWR